jgi:beta-N-acetylhexosaminidase
MIKFSSCLRFSIFAILILLLAACKPAKPKTENCAEIVSAATCQKIGQLLIVGFGGMDHDENNKITWADPNGTQFKENSNIARDISHWHVGGVIYFRISIRDPGTGVVIRERNIESGPQLTRLSSDLQAYNSKIRQHKELPSLPLIIAIDQEGGLVNPLVFATDVPNYTAQALGKNEAVSMDDPQKHQAALTFTRSFAQKIGWALRKYGINLNFAPDVDIDINPVNPIIGGLSRSFSDNPQIVTNQANQFIDGLHSANILATLKHFPGHGSSSGDTHKALVDVTQTYQKDKELIPYKTLIGQGFNDFVMSTHVINGQIDRSQCLPGNPDDAQNWCPGTMSRKTLTDLLRNQLGFKGVIVSDDMAMAAIAANYPLEVALEKGLNAGVDMFIVSNHDLDRTGEFVNTIARLIRDGKIPESRIDESYQRIVAVKHRIASAKPLHQN